MVRRGATDGRPSKHPRHPWLGLRSWKKFCCGPVGGSAARGLEADGPSHPLADGSLQDPLQVEAKYHILERNVGNKGLALALEAYHACRAIAAKPHAARGGPWVKPTLCDAELKHIRTLATKSLHFLLKYGEAKTSELLYKHLQDLRFGCATDAPDAAATARGVFVAKSRSGKSGISGRSGKSGVSGRRARSARIRSGTLLPGSAQHVRLKRGACPKERRRAEGLRRKQRNAKGK